MTCIRCKKDKSDGAFELRPSGRRRKTCAACKIRARKNRNDASREKTRAYHRNYRSKNVPSTILTDCRKSDKRAGRSGNDLTAEYVASLIERGCAYCGETGIRMTVDRIDNAKAHAVGNVNPCCIRCNYARGSMPYGAWMHVVPAIREARELGLFGSWRSVSWRRSDV